MANMLKYCDHRHLSDIHCLMAHPACLVCLISTVNDCTKKRRKKKPWKPSSSSRHITNLKQSIFHLSISMIVTLYHLPYLPWPSNTNRNNPICVMPIYILRKVDCSSFVSATSMGIFVAATNSTNQTNKVGGTHD
jgi:hypothetical protein